MSTAYPGAIDSFTIPSGTATLGGSTPTHTGVHQNEADAIVAIQTELGTNPKGASASVGARIAALDSAVVHLAGSEIITGKKIIRGNPLTSGIQGTDIDVMLSIESNRTLGVSDTLGDRYEIFRVGDSRGATAANRVGIFQKRGPRTGTWEYTQWIIGHYVDSTIIGEIQFGSVNNEGDIVLSLQSLGLNVDPIVGAGVIQVSDSIRIGRFTVATLPIAGFSGRIAFATNGRKNGEGAGAGTGVQCYDDGTAWRRVSDDSTVAA